MEKIQNETIVTIHRALQSATFAANSATSREIVLPAGCLFKKPLKDDYFKGRK